MPSSPRTSAYSSRGISSPVSTSTTVRSAASITPPVTPNITPAPEDSPSISSNSSSGRCTKSSPAWRIMRASSRVVRFASTSR